MNILFSQNRLIDVIRSAKLFSELIYSFFNRKDVLDQSIDFFEPGIFLDFNFQFWSFCESENQIHVIFQHSSRLLYFISEGRYKSSDLCVL